MISCSTSAEGWLAKRGPLGCKSYARGAPSVPYSLDKVFDGDVATKPDGKE